MGAGEWEDLLKKKLAYLPGSRDPGGGPILIVPLPSDPLLHDLGGISTTLKYLKTIPSSSLRDIGWVVIVDATNCPYRIVKPTVSTVNAALVNIRYLIVVRPEGFWDKQKVDCRRTDVDEIIFINSSKLNRYVEASQLPECFNGTLSYDHDLWIRKRKMYEEFVDEAESIRRDLELLQTELRREEPRSRASSLNELLRTNERTFNTLNVRVRNLIGKGREVIDKVQIDDESGFTNKVHLIGSEEASKRVTNLLEELSLQSSAIQLSWKKLQSAVQTYHEIEEVKHEMSEIGKWLVSAGQTLLRESRIGGNTAQAESLLREHEAIEMKCRETYARWSRLRYRVEETLENGACKLRALSDHDSRTLELRALKEYTDTLVRCFASRLDRRRTLILASTRFHRMIEQTEQRCKNLLEKDRWAKTAHNLDDLKKLIRELIGRKDFIEYLSGESTKAGEKLLDLLTVGVKDLSGRDVTPDYSRELNHVRKLLKSRYETYEKACLHVEFTNLKLRQMCQLLTCQHDLKQATDWLKSLLESLITTHSHIPRCLDEVPSMKIEHQKFQDTAKGTFDYGYECASAAVLVQKNAEFCIQDIDEKVPNYAAQNTLKSPKIDRKNSNFREIDSKNFRVENSLINSKIFENGEKLISDLEHTWKIFMEGSQEQLTRLRVAGIFYRTMDQHLNRLESLIELVEKKSNSFTDEEFKAHLVTREKLLKEIGRNVRLGKLLIERLKEKLVPELSWLTSSVSNTNESAQDAVTERINYVAKRAQHLDTLMLLPPPKNLQQFKKATPLKEKQRPIKSLLGSKVLVRQNLPVSASQKIAVVSTPIQISSSKKISEKSPFTEVVHQFPLPPTPIASPIPPHHLTQTPHLKDTSFPPPPKDISLPPTPKDISFPSPPKDISFPPTPKDSSFPPPPESLVYPSENSSTKKVTFPFETLNNFPEKSTSLSEKPTSLLEKQSQIQAIHMSDSNENLDDQFERSGSYHTCSEGSSWADSFYSCAEEVNSEIKKLFDHASSSLINDPQDLETALMDLRARSKSWPRGIKKSGTDFSRSFEKAKSEVRLSDSKFLRASFPNSNTTNTKKPIPEKPIPEKPIPEIVPDSQTRVQFLSSRSASLTKDIVSSFLDFRDQVLPSSLRYSDDEEKVRNYLTGKTREKMAEEDLLQLLQKKIL